MRVGVIRGDIPSPIFLADLESTSQTNFPTEPEGQTRYISRPTSVTVGAMMSANIPASLASGAIVFPLAINLGVNDALKRIENAVTGPNAQDAATAVHITDLSRRLSDQEKGARDRETRLTILESRLGTLGSVVKFIGVGGFITVIGLIAFYVGTAGRLP